MSGKTKGQKCASPQSRVEVLSELDASSAEPATALTANDVVQQGAIDDQILAQRQALDEFSARPLFTEPEEGYDRQFIAEHGPEAYFITLGALEYHCQQQLLDCPSPQRLVIEALYSQRPDWQERLFSAQQVMEKINDRIGPGQLSPEELQDLLDQLLAQGKIYQQSESGQDDLYYLAPEDLVITADDDLTADLLTLYQRAELIKTLGPEGYYRFRGALLQARRRGLQQAENLEQQVLIERLFYLSLGSRPVHIDPWQEFSLDQLALNGQLDNDQRLALRQELDDLEHLGLVAVSQLAGEDHFSLPVSPPAIAPKELGLEESEVNNIAVGGPVRYWASIGQLRQVASSAQRRCPDDPIARAALGALTEIALDDQLHNLWPAVGHSVRATPEEISERLATSGIHYSPAELNSCLLSLAADEVIDSFSRSEGNNYSLAYKSQQPAGNSSADGEQERRAEYLSGYHPAEYYQRRAQISEARQALDHSAISEYYPQLGFALSRQALDPQAPARSAQQLAAEAFPSLKPGSATEREVHDFIARQLQQLADLQLLQRQVIDGQECYSLPIY